MDRIVCVAFKRAVITSTRSIHSKTIARKVGGIKGFGEAIYGKLSLWDRVYFVLGWEFSSKND